AGGAPPAARDLPAGPAGGAPLAGHAHSGRRLGGTGRSARGAVGGVAGQRRAAPQVGGTAQPADPGRAGDLPARDGATRPGLHARPLPDGPALAAAGAVPAPGAGLAGPLETTRPTEVGRESGVPKGIRTPVTSVKGTCPDRARRWERGELSAAF